jgi:hypothetical protein
VEPGQAAVIEVVPRCRVSSTRWFQLAESPGLLQHSDFYRVAELLGEGRVPERDGYRLYFGEIHAHSGQVGGDEEVGDFAGCGVGSRKEGYEYALGPGGVDFFAMTDHEHQIAPDPEDYFGLAEAYERPGRFAVLPAYEFTSVLYGHRNVYFGGPGGTLVPSGKDGTWITWEPKHAAAPAELWEGLEKNGVPFFTAVHHPSSASHPAAKTIFHPEHDRLVEIYSCWGSSEYYGDFPRGVADRYRQLYVRDMLAEGQRLGFIASSDGHDGCPGNNQSPGVKHHHIYHFCGSGRAVVLAEELRRDAVFEALRARRCYATTGVPIVLSFTVNGHRMGSEIAALSGAERPRLRIGVEGTNGLKEIRIVKNGRVVHTEWPHGLFAHDLEWEDAAYEAGTPACYYVRVVQKDYESAWSSPVWIG